MTVLTYKSGRVRVQLKNGRQSRWLELSTEQQWIKDNKIPPHVKEMARLSQTT